MEYTEAYGLAMLLITLPPSSRNSLLTALCLLALQAFCRADIALETETGDLGKKGEWNFSQGIQFDHDPGGKTTFLLTQFEYAITDRSEILIEPFLYLWGRPKDSDRYSGMGDLEITPSYMFMPEQDVMPALVAAFKVKVPTASNREIGTGKFDWYPYLIINKHIGKWDLNANLGVSFFGQYGEEHLRDQFIYDFSVQHPITSKLMGIAEIFGNSAPTESEKATFAGAVALEYTAGEHFNIFISVGYDSDDTWSIRPGFNIPF